MENEVGVHSLKYEHQGANPKPFLPASICAKPEAGEAPFIKLVYSSPSLVSVAIPWLNKIPRWTLLLFLCRFSRQRVTAQIACEQRLEVSSSHVI
jgi:hypothetical protein